MVGAPRWRCSLLSYSNCVLVVVALLLAGCTGGSSGRSPIISDEAEAVPQAEEPTRASSNVSAPSPVQAVPLDGLFLTNCEGALTLNYLEKTVAGVRPPSGWPESAEPIVRVRIEAHRCERIAFGIFERGPVTVILETHDNHVPPENCVRDGDFTTTEVLNHMWVDDQTLVDAFRSAWNLPVDLSGPLESRVDPFGNPSYSVDIQGQTTILSTVIENGDLGTGTFSDSYRYFWPLGVESVGLLDLQSDTTTMTGVPAITGKVASPFVAAVVGNPYAGYGNLFSASSSIGSVQVFGDNECNPTF